MKNVKGSAFIFWKRNARELYQFRMDNHVQALVEIARKLNIKDSVAESGIRPFMRLTDGHAESVTIDRFSTAYNAAVKATPYAGAVLREFLRIFSRHKRALDSVRVKFQRRDTAREAEIEAVARGGAEEAWFVEFFLPVRKKNGEPLTAYWYPPDELAVKRTEQTLIKKIDEYFAGRTGVLSKKVPVSDDGPYIVVHEWARITLTRLIPRYRGSWRWVFGHAEYEGRSRGNLPGLTEEEILKALSDEIMSKVQGVHSVSTRMRYGEYIVNIHIGDGVERDPTMPAVQEIERAFAKKYPDDILEINNISGQGGGEYDF